MASGETASTSTPNMHQVDLHDLTDHQLTLLRSQVDQDLVIYKESVAALKQLEAKLSTSSDSLDKIPTTSNSVLMPMTGSLYVRGIISDRKSVVLDVGTGYFVQKNIPAAKMFFQKKLDIVSGEMRKFQGYMEEKVQARNLIYQFIENKKIMQARMVAQVAAASKSSSRFN